ncbi:hypothetical protein EUX98_g6196 [Antrodiella citrinella]|uniref:Glycoside hydrolase family 71 protein n=1 Tax=Antrodiella citrinella TaxID=2447956 RepID=A0A4S4MPV8_9APHY|nr:hypothetical protein EUX98_g6196 [Antrodiella citrinella]
MRSFALAATLGLCASLSAALPSKPHSPFAHKHKAVKRDGTPKAVFAHFMMGNAYPYTTQDFQDDIELAHASGIDAFAVNMGTDDWQPDHLDSFYQAAANSGTGFQLFPSFDMSVFPCGSADNAQTLVNYVNQYSGHPNQFKYDGRPLASTFSGESCSFGQGSAAQGWKSQFVDALGGNVYFVPAFFVDPSTFNQYSIDGIYNWNAGWPIQLTTSLVQSLLGSTGLKLTGLVSSAASAASNALVSQVTSIDSDTQYINGLSSVNAQGAKAYMTSVSPWFFTHYGPDTYNKNWVYYSDDQLYATRWDTIIANRDKFDLVEINTWNDYGESHYIAPVKGDQPNSQAWVDGFAHDADVGWLDMTNYYATAYKTGNYPEITEDKLYMWARPHPKDANSADGVGKPTNFEMFQDTLWAVYFATAPATVTLSTADGVTQSFNVQAGANKLSTQLTPGGYMHGTVVRNGQTIIDLKPDGYTFNPNPPSYNYNAFVAFQGANSTSS